ncbi:HNH endonuclease signature motif containing protein [Arthrobacter sp. TMS1-12-1]
MVRTLVDIEDISRIVDHLQALAAGSAEDMDLASGETSPGFISLQVRAEHLLAESDGADVAGSAAGGAAGGRAGEDAGSPCGDRFRNRADYLRARLGISRAEAKRRLDLAHRVLPGVSPPGAVVEPRAGAVGAASAAGTLSGQAATAICSAVDRVRCLAVPEQLVSMEHQLTRQALEADEDVLRVLARRWETVLDQDGQEPTEKLLRARQGVFFRGRRNGVHMLEIGATDEQFEQPAMVMNTATNPRTAGIAGTAGAPGVTGPSKTSAVPNDCADPHLFSHPGSRHDGGDGVSSVVHSLDAPTRAQSLLAELLSARSIRRIACEADIIPLVLGGEGQVLDIGRAGRLFPPPLRRALVARDRGCAFPDCTIPASWCEAHHMTPWSHGGVTSIDNGVLLCSHHHHVIHLGQWGVESHDGIPWFTPPPHLARHGAAARRNRYWHAQPRSPVEPASPGSDHPGRSPVLHRPRGAPAPAPRRRPWSARGPGRCPWRQ